ncbi:hypothetical protein NQ317_016599 [Molorchus minor]|uniref:Uncharacterized protein n=1 Tax=Molorchus minor TaxID=1323400 RepID=A0ABQ9J3N0_9CUCU|nr:hypothetical protein NQ317_016599 [Molorchus minor]
MSSLVVSIKSVLLTKSNQRWMKLRTTVQISSAISAKIVRKSYNLQTMRNHINTNKNCIFNNRSSPTLKIAVSIFYRNNNSLDEDYSVFNILQIQIATAKVNFIDSKERERSEEVYSVSIENENQLWNRIQNAVQELQNEETLRRVHFNFLRRIDYCINENGGHFTPN